MDDWTRRQLQDYLDELRQITSHCRDDMHEPNDMSAVMTGFVFDNAMGDNGLTNDGEMTIRITDELNGNYIWINLCTLIALARLANLED